MYKCKICDKEYEKRYSYIGHCSVHHRGDSFREKRKSKKLLNYEIKIINDNEVKIFKCKFCNKNFENGHILGGHIGQCKSNPNYKKNKSNILKGNLAKNFHWSEDDKKRISQTMTKYLTEHPDKVPYKLNHSSKMSYPENIFKNALESMNITGWTYNYQNSIYAYDFAFPELKIDIEIDGNTHTQEKVKRIDERRDLFSKENGWQVIRFTAQEVKENVLKCINQINVFF